MFVEGPGNYGPFPVDCAICSRLPWGSKQPKLDPLSYFRPPNWYCSPGVAHTLHIIRIATEDNSNLMNSHNHSNKKRKDKTDNNNNNTVRVMVVKIAAVSMMIIAILVTIVAIMVIKTCKMCMCIYIHTYIQTYMHTYIQTGRHMYVCNVIYIDRFMRCVVWICWPLSHPSEARGADNFPEAAGLWRLVDWRAAP